MPTRMIRGELLDSERYWAVTDEGRVMFVHLMLIADDFGCCTGAPIALRRLCTDGSKSLDRITKLVSELADVDLLRPYVVDKSPFIFIPRFGQRLRNMRLRHPVPPVALLQDHAEVLEKMLEIKANQEILSAPRGQTAATRGQLPIHEGLKVEGLKVEERSLKVEGKPPVDKSTWTKTSAGIEAEAVIEGVVARPGESHYELKQRIFKAKQERLTGTSQ